MMWSPPSERPEATPCPRTTPPPCGRWLTARNSGCLLRQRTAERQEIAGFQPLRQYLDQILSSPGPLAITQIAADYGLSAKRLNHILHEEGIQHCVNGQWILYRKHMGQGYTKSATIPITHGDGSPDAKVHTYWTQKGRIFLHQVLTKRGILAVMDRVC